MIALINNNCETSFLRFKYYWNLIFNRILLLLSLSIIFSGCTAPINKKTLNIYLERAIAAQQQDNWELARQYYGKALVNAELAGTDKRQLAVINYEYGRSSGVVCDYEVAEKYLLKALALDQQVSGPIHMSLVELARLNYDQNKYAQATSYFGRVIPIFEENKAFSRDPIGVADILNEYVNALKAVGRNSEADEVQERATHLKENNRGKDTKTDRTPYGTKCQQAMRWSPPALLSAS